MLTLSQKIGKLFDSVGYRKQEKAASTYAPYRQMLEDLLDDRELDFGTVEELLEEMRKTRSDLERDCELLAKRREWFAQLQAEPAAAKEEQRIARQIEENGREFAAARAKYEQRANELNQQRIAVGAVLSVAHSARVNLQDNILSPDALRLADLRRQLAEIAKVSVPMVREIEKLQRDQRPSYEITAIEEKLRPLQEQSAVIQAEIAKTLADALTP